MKLCLIQQTIIAKSVFPEHLKLPLLSFLVPALRLKQFLCNRLPKNLREGNWLLDYISGRLKTDPGTAELGRWLDEVPFSVLKKVPRYLIPRYFDAIVTRLYCKLLDSTW